MGAVIDKVRAFAAAEGLHEIAERLVRQGTSLMRYAMRMVGDDQPERSVLPALRRHMTNDDFAYVDEIKEIVENFERGDLPEHIERRRRDRSAYRELMAARRQRQAEARQPQWQPGGRDLESFLYRARSMVQDIAEAADLAEHGYLTVAQLAALRETVGDGYDQTPLHQMMHLRRSKQHQKRELVPAKHP
jgi:hypothetical protein